MPSRQSPSKRPARKPSAKSKRGPGQPEKEIDLRQLEMLCQMQCTDIEIAGFFNVSRKTIERRKAQDDFRDTMEQGKLKGLVSLRQAQFKNAVTNNNTTMQIWLGKQFLNQRDKFPDEDTEQKPVGRIEYQWVTPKPDDKEPEGPKLASDLVDKTEAILQ